MADTHSDCDCPGCATRRKLEAAGYVAIPDEPTVTLTRSTLLRMHRNMEQLHQLVYFSDDVDQRIKSAVGDRLWNLEALIESAGFTLDHGQIRDQ